MLKLIISNDLANDRLTYFRAWEGGGGGEGRGGEGKAFREGSHNGEMYIVGWGHELAKGRKKK